MASRARALQQAVRNMANNTGDCVPTVTSNEDIRWKQFSHSKNIKHIQIYCTNHRHTYVCTYALKIYVYTGTQWDLCIMVILGPTKSIQIIMVSLGQFT